MTKSYAQIVKEIEALQHAADRARQKEVEGVIARIREAISVYELTPADLGFTGSAKQAAGKAAGNAAAKKTRMKRGSGNAAKAAKPAAVIKFRNDNGGTWGGRGKRPQWLRDALNEGKQLSDFAVK